MVGGVVLGRCQAQVGIVGQFGGAAAGAFGEVTFGQSLQPPGRNSGRRDDASF